MCFLFQGKSNNMFEMFVSTYSFIKIFFRFCIQQSVLEELRDANNTEDNKDLGLEYPLPGPVEFTKEASRTEEEPNGDECLVLRVFKVITFLVKLFKSGIT